MWKTMMVILAVVAVVLLVVLVFMPETSPPPSPPGSNSPPQQAISSYAVSSLSVLAMGQAAYSVRTGGAAVSNFSPSMAPLTNEVRRAIADALIYPGHEPKPYYGYVFRLMEHPSKDNFRSNFIIRAEPAPGFVGKTLEVDVTERPKEIEP